jgi:hypothetical protein
LIEDEQPQLRLLVITRCAPGRAPVVPFVSVIVLVAGACAASRGDDLADHERDRNGRARGLWPVVCVGAPAWLPRRIGKRRERVEGVLAQARASTPWRAALGLPEPSPRLSEAIDAMGRVVRAATSADGRHAFEALLAAAGEDRSDEGGLEHVVRRVLLSMLEQRGTRQPVSDGRC